MEKKEEFEEQMRSYEHLLLEGKQNYWLKNTHWADHPATKIPPPKEGTMDEELNRNVCARTDGFYKNHSTEKTKSFEHHPIQMVSTEEVSMEKYQKNQRSKMLTAAREARSNHRRLLTEFSRDSELLKFNTLKFRKKHLRIAKSSIHDWGLFAMEPIAADEMVIEYVGEVIRPIIADKREREYQSRGIRSSYLFRIEEDTVIDATKRGNLARFINHSCNPNCYAKMITIESQKKIVIYSKQKIFVNEEITLDYKLPSEETKIPCKCGAETCRGTIN